MCTITVALALARTFSLIFKVSVILLQHYCGHSYSHPPRLLQTRYIGYLIRPPDHSHQTFAAHARSMLNASQRLQLTEVCVEGLKDSKVMMLSLLFALSIILNVVIFFPSPMQVEVAAAAQITLIGLLMTCSQAERDQVRTLILFYV